LAIARSRQLVRLAVAPKEVRDPRRLYRAMTAAGITAAEAARATNRRTKWVELRRPYAAGAVAGVLRIPGVHATDIGGREYVQSPGSRKLLGSVGREGRGTSGLELYLDSLLRGHDGRSRVVRGLRGARFESPEAVSEPARRGHVVRLTINQALQDICDKVLADAVARTVADGGDVVVLDPKTGEVRCLGSQRRARVGAGASALIEPFEPGSTLKPFYAGRLLERNLATPDELIETYNGVYKVGGRTITDVHKAPVMSLADVIRHSSNIGIVRFADRLTDRDVYELLRDVGFGTATGVPYPSEASGTLREPRRWTRDSRASLAIGYEVAVTPLQLAAAYGAIANGGNLMAPALVKEIRDDEGRLVFVHTPRVLRRVFERKTTRALLEMLESVVDSGTATDASLTTFSLAGKSGTARRMVRGVYGREYTASFVALFPADDPQYVVLAKLDNPRGEFYYGGKAAAPIAKAVIEGALAAREASLDWAQLASHKVDLKPVTPAVESTVVAGALATDTLTGEFASPVARVPLIGAARPVEPMPPTTIRLDQPLPRDRPPLADVFVPDVRGLPLRVAVRELHGAGLRVLLISGTARETSPPAGARVRAGALVRVARP
jgi:cell division protein FtsI (penicillin-binding protein 3)